MSLAEQPVDAVKHESDVDWIEERSPDSSARRYRKKLSAATGAQALGCSLYKVPPGVRPWPRHYHCANEEAIYVLAGHGTMVVGDKELTLRAGDYVALPAGGGHAHQVRNESDGDLVFLCMSTMVHPDVCVYPDSGKLGVFAGTAPGGPDEDSTLKLFLSMEPNLPYWHGEL